MGYVLLGDLLLVMARSNDLLVLNFYGIRERFEIRDD